VQQDTFDHLVFDIPALIAYISTVTPLRPGDVIATGTPAGVGFTRKPPLWNAARGSGSGRSVTMHLAIGNARTSAAYRPRKAVE
jgi:2-keto-4-pentenoate hydratase/2-oxohepta-3-ene-1,7-dioic acid hydratase in catechol pathway